MKNIIVSGGFDDIRSIDIRFLQEAASLGKLDVLLWPDETFTSFYGHPPKFPFLERQYFLSSIRFVNSVLADYNNIQPDSLPEEILPKYTTLCVTENMHSPEKLRFCQSNNLEYVIIKSQQLQGFPLPPPLPITNNSKKVVVTGCFDWLHSGHIRFFEEVSRLGSVFAIVGHDQNIRDLKGPNHPMFNQHERRYCVAAIKFVTDTLISSGHGWLDAEPEILKLKPDIYAVNEDGDRPEKRKFCEKHGINYIVLKRLPKNGLPPRSSTNLRGF